MSKRINSPALRQVVNSQLLRPTTVNSSHERSVSRTTAVLHPQVSQPAIRLLLVAQSFVSRFLSRIAKSRLLSQMWRQRKQIPQLLRLFRNSQQSRRPLQFPVSRNWIPHQLKMTVSGLPVVESLHGVRMLKVQTNAREVIDCGLGTQQMIDRQPRQVIVRLVQGRQVLLYRLRRHRSLLESRRLVHKSIRQIAGLP